MLRFLGIRRSAQHSLFLRGTSMLRRLAVLGLFLASCLAVGLLTNRSARAGDDWLPISPEELQMKSYPASPNAHAILLYREEHTDHIESFETNYFRIKIFAEEGKKLADIEIPFIKGFFDVRDIKARTIQPDGRIINFDGKIFEKTAIKARGAKLLAKTFSLPDVQVGSIIDYRYTVRWDPAVLLNARWIIQHELFTRRAVFTLRRYRETNLGWVNFKLPANKEPKEEKGLIRLELQDVLAFVEEDFMPPENELKARVQFFYSERPIGTPDQFWAEHGKFWSQNTEEFIGKRKGIERAVAEIVSPDDAPEAKLRKIYARVQQVRNTSFERERTEKEEKREKLKENNNVEDLLKRGYGNGTEINFLFIALCRAAGFEAWSVRVSTRDDYFFNKNLLDRRQLNNNVVLVRAGTKDYFLDPGTALAPFGLMPWYETGVIGMRLSSNGTTFVNTTAPTSVDAVIDRKASLKLEDDGGISGTLIATFSGQEALRRRLNARHDDDTERRKDLVDEAKDWLPAGATVELLNTPDWTTADQPLRAEFRVRIEGLGTSTGRRLLLPVTVLAGSKQRRFEHSTRTHPVYFNYPFRTQDDVTLELPAVLQVSSLPAAQKNQADFGLYQNSCQKSASALRCQRVLVIEGIFFQVQYYPRLRGFFETVRSGDEEQVVLQSSASGARN